MLFNPGNYEVLKRLFHYNLDPWKDSHHECIIYKYTRKYSEEKKAVGTTLIEYLY